MAITAEELRILVRAETKQAQAELERFRRKSRSTTIDLKQLAKQLIGPLSVTAGITALAAITKNAISSSVQYAAKIERIGVSFETLLGSASEAQTVLEDLRQFSVKTPFTFEELAPAAQRLLAFGTEAKDVVQTMRDLGNAAQGDRMILDRLVDAYGKVQAGGRASLEELNRFTEAGVPLMKQLAEDLGLTNEELFKFVSQGKVGFQEVDRALQNLTRGQGAFAGMLDEQSLTLEGAMSTLKGSVQELGRSIANDLLPFLTKSVQELTKLIDKIATGRNLDDIFEVVFGDDFGKAAGETAVEQLQSVERQLELAGIAQAELQRILSDRKLFGGLEESSFTQRRTKSAIERFLFLLESDIIALEKALPELQKVVDEMEDIAGGGGGTGPGDGSLDFLNNLYKRTIEAQRELIAQQIARVEGFAEQGPKAAAVLKMLREELDKIDQQLAVTEQTFQRDFMSPDTAEEYAARFFDIIVDYSQQAVDEINASWGDLVLGGPDVSFDPIINEIDEVAAAIRRLEADLKKAFTNIVASETINAIEQIGAALAMAQGGADAASQSLQDFVTNIIAALPQLFLQAALRTVGQVPLEVTALLLAAAGVSAFISGFRKQRIADERSASPTAPSSAVVNGQVQGGFGNPIYITNNITGSLITQSELDKRIVRTVERASSGH